MLSNSQRFVSLSMQCLPLKSLLKSILIILFLLTIQIATFAQVKEPTNTPSEWSKPYPPFRIVGNLYYVGTYDLACYLIVTSKGNILINTGLANSSKLIQDNIATLGFKLSDTKILLTTQAHYDHMGAMAEIQRKTDARVLVNEPDAQVMKDGGSSDYALGNGTPTYQGLNPHATLKNKEVISLGATRLTMLSHPGHTQGSCSYMLDVNEGKKTYRVLIANLPTIVTEKKFPEVTHYPTIEKDYKFTLQAMKALKFDIWLASHASQFNLHQKHTPRSPYNPASFIDPSGYQKALIELQAQYDKKIIEN